MNLQLDDIPLTPYLHHCCPYSPPRQKSWSCPCVGKSQEQGPCLLEGTSKDTEETPGRPCCLVIHDITNMAQSHCLSARQSSVISGPKAQSRDYSERRM